MCLMVVSLYMKYIPLRQWLLSALGREIDLSKISQLHKVLVVGNYFVVLAP